MDNLDELYLEANLQNKTGTPSSPFQSSFDKMTKDMHFVATFLIVYGAINCLTIIGALIGVPIIFAALSIKESADHFSFFKKTNNPASMRTAFEAQGKYFHIFKILIIISLVIMALSIILAIVFVSTFIGMIYR